MAKTKEGRSLGHGRTEKSGDSALSRKQKAEKVSIVFAKKKKKLNMAMIQKIHGK